MINDCDNVMVRDALPELAAGVIGVADAAAIRAHVDGCESCRTELLLIQTVRDARGAVRSVDVASIVRALPTPPKHQTEVVDLASRRRARSFPMQWRAAAAALVVAAGSLGVYAANRAPEARPSVVQPAPTTVPAQVATVSPPATTLAPVTTVAPATTPVAVEVAKPAAAPALLVAGAAHDLRSAEQKQLLKELEAFDGSVSADPETARYDFDEESGL